MPEKSTKPAVLDRHVVIDPDICHGKPHLARHRIRVQDIAVWHERLGMSVAEISADYELYLAEVHSALAYYFDYKADIDQDIVADQIYFEAFKEENPSLLQERIIFAGGQ